MILIVLLILKKNVSKLFICNYNVITNEDNMIISVIKIGNSKGIRLPKAFLENLSITKEVNMELMENAIVLTPVKNAREGWDEQFCAMHEAQEDNLIETPEPENFNWEEE